MNRGTFTLQARNVKNNTELHVIGLSFTEYFHTELVLIEIKIEFTENTYNYDIYTTYHITLTYITIDKHK